MNILLLAFAAIQSYLLWQLWQTSDNHTHRLNRLEQGKANPVPEKQHPKQIWEKPVVPGAKEVQSLPIGGGRLQFDNENQVAEWV